MHNSLFSPFPQQIASILILSHHLNSAPRVLLFSGCIFIFNHKCNSAFPLALMCHCGKAWGCFLAKADIQQIGGRIQKYTAGGPIFSWIWALSFSSVFQKWMMKTIQRYWLTCLFWNRYDALFGSWRKLSMSWLFFFHILSQYVMSYFTCNEVIWSMLLYVVMYCLDVF